MSRLSTALLLSITAGIGLLFAVGCDSAGSSMNASEEDDGSGSESTTLQVRLTDAPGDVTKANVVIESVSIVPEEDTSDGDSTDVGVSVLTEENFEVDLTTLEGEVDTLMSELEIQEGTYSQVRMITAHPDSFDVAYETSEGDTSEANLFIPSGSQTGIKVNFDSSLTVGASLDTVDVTLDFDVKDSFIPKGPEGRTSDYNFKPTVQASVDTTGGN